MVMSSAANWTIHGNAYMWVSWVSFIPKQKWELSMLSSLSIFPRNPSISTLKTFLFILLFYLFIYLFLAVLGLRFCARAFSSCGERGPLFIAVRGPLTIVASLVAEHRLQTRRLSSCGSRA